MKKMCTVFLIVTILTEYLQKYESAIPETENNLFYNINKKLQIVIKKLYNSRDKTLLHSRKGQLLLKMQKNLKKLSKFDLKTYKDIQVALKTSDIETIKALNSLNDIMKDILNKKQEIDSTTATNMENNELRDTSVETLHFFEHFLSKMDAIIPKRAPSSPKTSTTRNNAIILAESRRKNPVKTYNLKFWRPSNSSEDIEFNITRRVYKGVRAEIKKYPFVVSVHDQDEFMCAGSIISSELVITAASCLLRAYKNNKYHDLFTVRAGSTYVDRGGTVLTVSYVFFHPNFDPVYLTNNLVIAGMRTEYHFREKKRRIRRIEYGGFEDIPDGITMLGWGVKDADDENAGYFQPLLSTDLDIYKLKTCKIKYSRHYVNDGHFCAGFLYKGGGACNRDVGGPAVVGGVLVGVMSFGPPECGTPGAPTVFTNLGYYVQWIDSVVKKFVMRAIENRTYTEISDLNFISTSEPIFDFNITETTTVVTETTDTSTRIKRPIKEDDFYPDTTPVTTTKKTTTKWKGTPGASASSYKQELAFLDASYKPTTRTYLTTITTTLPPHKTKPKSTKCTSTTKAERKFSSYVRPASVAKPDTIDGLATYQPETSTLNEMYLKQIEQIEDLFLYELETQKKYKIEREGIQTVFTDYKPQTESTNEEAIVIDSHNSEDILSDISNNYEVDDNPSEEGFSIEYKITQLHDRKLGKSITPNSQAIPDKHYDYETAREGMIEEKIIHTSDKKQSSPKTNNRFHKIKSNLRENRPTVKAKKNYKMTQLHEATRKKKLSIYQNSENDEVLVSRTMPKYYDYDDYNDRKSDDAYSSPDKSKSVLDYINIY